MLFSATMPDPIVTLARRFLHTPVTVHAGHSAETGASPLTKKISTAPTPSTRWRSWPGSCRPRGAG